MEPDVGDAGREGPGRDERINLTANVNPSGMPAGPIGILAYVLFWLVVAFLNHLHVRELLWSLSLMTPLPLMVAADRWMDARPAHRQDLKLMRRLSSGVPPGLRSSSEIAGLLSGGASSIPGEPETRSSSHRREVTPRPHPRQAAPFARILPAINAMGCVVLALAIIAFGVGLVWMAVTLGYEVAGPMTWG